MELHSYRRRRNGRLLGLTASLVAVILAVAGQTASAQVGRHVRGPSVGWGNLIPVDSAAGPSGGLSDVSCSSTRFCAAVDVDGNALTFRETTWSRPRNIDSDVYGFTSVSCPRSTFCFAADASGEESRWNGKGWSNPRTFDASAYTPDPSVSCTSPEFCAAVDNWGHELVWRGKSWRRAGSGGGELQGVSCTGPSFCAAVNSNGDLATWNGERWLRPRTVDSGDDLRAISCEGTTFCAAVGDAALILKRRGSSWSVQSSHLDGVALVSVSCSSRSFCMAADEVGDAYYWNGGRWIADGMPSPNNGMAVWCAGAKFCAGVTSGGAALFYAERPDILTRSLPKAVVGRAYSAKLKVIGGVRPYVFSVSSGMPAGLKLTRSGVVTGRAKKAGSFRLKIAVRDRLAEHGAARVALRVLR